MKITKNLSDTIFFALFCCVWLAHFWINKNLWFDTGRTFPQVPFFGNDFHFPAKIALIAMFAALLLLPALKNHRKIVALLFIFGFIAMVCADVNRLQPYYYCYFLAMCGMVFYDEKTAVLRLLLGGCYFWSGIFKFNPSYTEAMQSVFQRTEISVFLSIPPVIYWLIAVFEVLLGVIFLDFRTKSLTKSKLAAALTLHLGIIFVLTAASWNKTVILWNVFMAGLILLIYLQQQNADTEKHVVFGIKHILFAAFTVFLPALNFLGLWDNYLSWKVYSGNVEKYRLEVHDFPHLRNSPHAKFDLTEKKHVIYLNDWLGDETKTFFYPEKRYFEKLKKILKTQDK